jgi:membrane-associated phospholipid phosphatase
MTPGFAARAKRHGWLKFGGSVVFMLAFFAGYFLALRHPGFAATRLPATALDRWIQFQPAALPLYLSLWCYILLVPALIWERSELMFYAREAAALAVTGLLIFFVWPTTVPDAGVDWSRHPAFARLKAVDASGNACPSLHVAFAVLSAVWLDRLLRQMGVRAGWRFLSWFWCLGIVYSTLATKQHVAVDVLAGAGLGWLYARPPGRPFPARP